MSVAETGLPSNTNHSSENAHQLHSWEPEHSWAIGHSPAPSSDFGRRGQLCHPSSSWFRLIAGADLCKTGQAGDMERIQRGRFWKDKHFWDHQPFPHKFNTWWHNSNLFFPQHASPVKWMSSFSCCLDSQQWALFLQAAQPNCCATLRAYSQFHGFAAHHLTQHCYFISTSSPIKQLHVFLHSFWVY